MEHAQIRPQRYQRGQITNLGKGSTTDDMVDNQTYSRLTLHVRTLINRCQNCPPLEPRNHIGEQVSGNKFDLSASPAASSAAQTGRQLTVLMYIPSIRLTLLSKALHFSSASTSDSWFSMTSMTLPPLENSRKHLKNSLPRGSEHRAGAFL